MPPRSVKKSLAKKPTKSSPVALTANPDLLSPAMPENEQDRDGAPGETEIVLGEQESREEEEKVSEEEALVDQEPHQTEDCDADLYQGDQESREGEEVSEKESLVVQESHQMEDCDVDLSQGEQELREEEDGEEETLVGEESHQTEENANLSQGGKPVLVEGAGVTSDDKAETSSPDDLNDNDANGSESEENDEDDPSLCMQSLTERKKQKEFEIFVGGLEKSAVDEDLIKVFGVFGEIHSLRIIRNPVTQKSKGYAFVRYASVECAKKALDELKEGIEIRGKRVGVAASQDNGTLYVGNICKTWTKEQVLESLTRYGIEQVEHIILPDDPKNEGKTKGFAFVEFSSHSDAMAAFQRLRKADAIFGRDRSAKVAFSTSMNPSYEVMHQVKTVYFDNVPDSWDEAKLKETCQQYGEIEKIQLFRKSTTSKKKDFAFVEFTSRENALACVEGINKCQLGEGEFKIQANLARPPSKGRVSKQSARGGFKINKGRDIVNESGKSKKGKTKSKKVIVMGRAKQKPEDTKSSKKNKLKDKGTKRKHVQQDVHYHKGRKTGTAGKGISIKERPSKKSRKYHSHGDIHGRQPNIFDHQRTTSLRNPEGSYARMATIYEPRYTVPATTYQSYPQYRTYGSTTSYHDLAPHAGYLPPVKQHQNPYRSGAYESQSRVGLAYTGALPAVQTTYPGHGSYSAYEAGYTYPSSSGAYRPGGSTYAPRRSYYR